MKTIAVVSLFGSMLVMAVACGSAADVAVQPCDPDGPFPDPECRKQAEADAGTDASDASDSKDASDDGPNAQDSSANLCGGVASCVPVPSENNAGKWSLLPVSLWMGPSHKLPKCCPGACVDGPPGDIPNEMFRLFDKVINSPAECDPCECGASEGQCTGLPPSIEIRSGTCGQAGAGALPFNGPAGWDGSCSNEGGLAAGALCNGIPCAQSIWAAPLPGPVSESCAPKSATPSFKTETNWEVFALACQGNTREDDCGSSKKYCLNDPGPEWLFCVHKEGVHSAKECPANYNYARYVLYPEETLDDRGCEACSCGEPEGSACFGTVTPYKDSACQEEFTPFSVGSMGEGCTNVLPPGTAVGSKTVSPLEYMPGACAGSGGKPKGAVSPDPMNAVTFCCTSFFLLE